ncbi:FMR1-interacting protein NUFIP2 isoform X2 [Trichomycterus rosablanca]|uniref:FMR1-interacting protein NUFIP2 isoform X2 n=1 Tax=Trichomycterus rosablanca TaxID=2290929 RepID=UPI002F352C55
MEEVPSVGGTRSCLSKGVDDRADGWRLSVNNDQSCCQLQDEETKTKKTENGKITGLVVEGEEIPASLDSVSHNAENLPLDPKLKPKPSGQASALKGEQKGNNTSRNSMDCKNDKPSELIAHEGKKEALASLNGVVTLNCGQLSNGYPCNDGSGSESGYTTPKKRRAQRNGRAVDNVNASNQGKAMQQAGKQEPASAATELADRTSAAQVDSNKASLKVDSHTGGFTKVREAAATPPPQPMSAPEVYRKSSGKKFEDKSTKTKVATSAKEDSWTLFKPPPVFPVDNSSAKIVPKISYASKVKENLNKAAQAGTDAPSPAPQVPGRPSQVPMSAVKTITSASFSNGEGNICPLPGPHFSSVQSVPVSSSAGTDHVASSSTSSGNVTSTSVPEPRKPNLFVYPLSGSSSSNMQLNLPSGRQSDPPSSAPNQKSLGDIFQNQWGLSFINEPSGSPEGPTSCSSVKDKPKEEIVAMQAHSVPQTLDQQTFAKAYDSDNRTSAQSASKGGNLILPATGVSTEGLPQASNLELDTHKDEPGISGAIVFCSSSKDVGVDVPRKLSLAREQGYTKGFERRASWDFFDLKAAVVYHTKEMENIFNLQKQDNERLSEWAGLCAVN